MHPILWLIFDASSHDTPGKIFGLKNIPKVIIAQRWEWYGVHYPFISSDSHATWSHSCSSTTRVEQITMWKSMFLDKPTLVIGWYSLENRVFSAQELSTGNRRIYPCETEAGDHGIFQRHVRKKGGLPYVSSFFLGVRDIPSPEPNPWFHWYRGPNGIFPCSSSTMFWLAILGMGRC